LRGALGHAVGSQLRVVPELMVYVDDSLEYEENIDRLLRGEGESPIK
jgi:ribosome-binding factor A